MKQKLSRSDEAMDELMKVIHTQVDNFDSLKTQEERNKSAATIAVLAEKVQRLENVSTARARGNRDFWLKVCAIAAEIGISLLGLAFMQRNLKYIHRFEGSEVITGIGRSVASEAVSAGKTAMRAGVNLMKWMRF